MNTKRTTPLIAIAASAIAALALCGCAANKPATTTASDIPTTEPTGEGVIHLSESTRISATALTPTQETESAFVPEGFQIGELGLLRNPATNRDVLQFNPEADWAGFRKYMIESIWQANRDWAKYTGVSIQASQMTKEEFLDRALSGEELTFGIPVRGDSSAYSERFKEQTGRTDKGFPGCIELRTVTAKLDNISLQGLTSKEFKEYTGFAWTNSNQDAWNPLLTYLDKPFNAIYFEVNARQLQISIGTFYDAPVGDNPIPLYIGAFDASLAEKYPGYFGEDGVSQKANLALGEYLYQAFAELNYFPGNEFAIKEYGADFYVGVKDPDGTVPRFINVGLVQQNTVLPENSYPDLFALR